MTYDLKDRIHSLITGPSLSSNIDLLKVQIEDFLSSGGDFEKLYYINHIGRELNKRLTLADLGSLIEGDHDSSLRPLVSVNPLPPPTLSLHFSEPTATLTVSTIQGTGNTFLFERSTTSTFNSGTVTNLQNTQSLTTSDTLSSGGIYYYRVKEISQYGESEWSLSQSLDISDFDPGLISTELWLDSADSSTIITGTNSSQTWGVVQWDDKSGNTNNVTAQGIGAPMELFFLQNNLNVINLDGPTYFEHLNFTLPTSGNLQIFIICEVSSIDNLRDSILSTNASDKDFQIEAGHDSEMRGNIFAHGLTTSNPSVASSTGAGSSEVTGMHIWNATFDFDSGEYILRLDGEQVTGTSTGTYLRKLTLTQDLKIFGNRADTRFPEGNVAEVIISEDISDSKREKLEGYLAHKWGLSSSLNSSHPYKTFAPLEIN